MSELTRETQAEADPLRLLQGIVETAVKDIPGADFAGTSLFGKDRVTSDATTDPLVDEVDQIQYAVGEGGRAWRPGVSTTPYWPTTWKVSCAGPSSLPGPSGSAAVDAVGATYSSKVMPWALSISTADTLKPFSDDDETLAMLIGAHAAVAMAATRNQQNFNTALASRDIIGQAKGILMERHKICQQQAFEMLVWASQHTHRKLRDVDAQLAETGDITIA